VGARRRFPRQRGRAGRRGGRALRTARQTLSHLRRLGIRISVSGGSLKLRAAKGVLTPELRDELAHNKAGILALLGEANPPEDAGPLEAGRTPVTRAPVSGAAEDAADGPSPLSFAQQRLWFLQQLAPANSSYNLGSALRIEGALDVRALRESLVLLALRHETLRTTFPDEGGVPSQRIGDARPVPLAVTDLSALPPADREGTARGLVEQERRRPFVLAAECALRVSLFRLDTDDHVLLVVMHHIIADGWSLSILLRELAVIYDARRADSEPGLAPLPVRYVDYARWQRRRLQGAALDVPLEHWRRALAGAAPLELPTDRTRPQRQGYAGARESVFLPAQLVAGLERLSRQSGASLYMTLLAGFAVLMQRYAGQDDIVVGTPAGNRDRTEFEGLVGCFVNMLALRTDAGGDPGFRVLLERVRDVSLAAFRHQDVPFERLVEELVTERDLSRNPLFQVFFALQNVPDASFDVQGLATRPFPFDYGTTDLDLDVFVSPDDSAAGAGGLRVSFLYATDLFDAATVREMAAAYRVLLQAAVREPDVALSRLPLLDEAGRRLEVVAGPALADDGAGARCLHELFEARAAATPDAPAVASQGERLTYAELDARAERLARRLRALGVGADVLVGIAVERGLDLPVGLLGILKAGGAYVPLDPAHPTERLAHVLADTGARVLVTQQGSTSVVRASCSA
jgi:hypothetical protein